MRTFKEAQEILKGLARSFGKEHIDPAKALGRTIAEPLIADRDYPPFNRATMDGFAMPFADIEKGILEFTVVDTIFAGQVSEKALFAGECYKIMTGAAVPPFADLVIRREDTTDNDNQIRIQPDTYLRFQNISRQGEDIRSGETVIGPAINGTPAAISVLAALGKGSILVEKLPRVALFTTGNEIVEVGKPVTPVQIRNSNQYLLRALLQKWGIAPFLCEHVKDEKEDLYEMLSKGLSGDIMIISGGVSAGDADFVPEILTSLGVKNLFHKLAIKPGKPIWCGHIPEGAIVFALPGNPFSSLVTFTLFVDDFLSHCFGYGRPKLLNMPLVGERSKKSNLDEFFPVSIQDSPIGARPVSFNGSGDIVAALFADGIAWHPQDSPFISSDTSVTFYSFKR